MQCTLYRRRAHGCRSGVRHVRAEHRRVELSGGEARHLAGEPLERGVVGEECDGRAAFDAVISALVDMGREVPAPVLSARDFAPVSASGKFVARVPRSIHSQLVARARTEGVSLNTLVLAYIAEGLGRRERQRA